MFKDLLRRILRRPEPKKRYSPRACPVCGEHIPPKVGENTKAQHFIIKHPEYKIAGYPILKYVVCGHRIRSFAELVEKHRHWQKGS